MFELIAAKTRDGRFRFAAHRLMNYLLYQKEPLRRHRGSFVRETSQHIAIAWFVADDSVKPVMPSPASQYLTRKQVVRIKGKADAAKFLADLDPAPDKAKPCCNLVVVGFDVPSKFVFRSGWQPGDMYALVDLFIGADPLNPGGVIGFTRWGAPFTQAISAKGSAEQNRLLIEDLDGTHRQYYNKLPVGVIGETWSRNGETSDARISVPFFDDTPAATLAVALTLNWDSLPVDVRREFVFVKNRFLVVRDVVDFTFGFHARVSPIWNTQNVGPQAGPNFANTYFSQVRGGGSPDNPLNAVPYDMLAWFAPRDDCKLQVVDRTAADPRTGPVPAQLRYVWEGRPEDLESVQFTQLYWPHAPFRSRVASNAAGQAKLEWIGGEHAATAGASAIQAIIDTPKLTVLRCAFEKNRTEWIVFNTYGEMVTAPLLKTDASLVYIDVRDGKPQASFSKDATTLEFEGVSLLPPKP